jgi:hypothetical protein
MADIYGNRNANSTKVLLQVDESQEVADVINGHLITFPPAEPVELDTFIADTVMQHMGDIYGFVEVPMTKTKTGVTWDVDKAIELATERLKKCERASVEFYVRQQLEDRIAAGKPALAPTGRALMIIKKHNINLRTEYGLSPVGWKDIGADVPNTDNAQVSDKALTALVSSQKLQIESQAEQIATQATQIETLGNQFAELMAVLQAQNAPKIS